MTWECVGGYRLKSSKQTSGGTCKSASELLYSKSCDHWLTLRRSSCPGSTPISVRSYTTHTPCRTSEVAMTSEVTVTSEVAITSEVAMTSEVVMTNEVAVTSEVAMTSEVAVTSEVASDK